MTTKQAKKLSILLKKLDKLGFCIHAYPSHYLRGEGLEIVVDTPIKYERINPFTGANCQLENSAALLYDFICFKHFTQILQYKHQIEFTPGVRQLWNRSRMYFLEFWPDEYYKLID